MLTDLSGASRWFAGSIVAYTPTAKVEFLGVADSSIERKGTISVKSLGRWHRASVRALAAISGSRSPVLLDRMRTRARSQVPWSSD